MSEIKVNSIKGVGASAAAITVNNTDGTCTANLTNRTNRNLIINGAMQVAQRGTSSTSNGYQTIDRFRSDIGSASTTFTQSQQDLSSSDAPFALGFRKYKRIALAGAGTAAAGTYVEATAYRVEAQDLATSGWNYTSSSSFLTLQFWFRCSTNQTFYCFIRADDGTARQFPFSFTASGNNVWTKVTKTISGNSGITIENDNGIGMSIFLLPYYGTNFTNDSTSLDTWSDYGSGQNSFPDMASTWLTAGASTFDFTGVQLEVGVGTDFEHRSFAQELQLCKRYFQVHNENGKFTGNTSYYRSGSIETQIKFEPEMRATPTFSAATGTNYYYFYRNNSFDNFNSWGSTNAMGQRGGAINASTSSASNGIAGAILVNTGGTLHFSAEL